MIAFVWLALVTLTLILIFDEDEKRYKMNFYIDKMKELGADGIDFVTLDSLLAKGANPLTYKIVASYTLEQMEQKTFPIPKTGYLFWKVVAGKKEYLSGTLK